MKQRFNKGISSIQAMLGVTLQRRRPDQNDWGIPEALQLFTNEINGQDGYANIVFSTRRRLHFFDKSIVFILLAKVFTEAHLLPLDFLLLYLHDDNFFLTIPVPDPGGIIEPINGQVPTEGLYSPLPITVGIQAKFLRQRLQGYDIHFRESRKKRNGHGVVFHQVFKDHVVHGVCNLHERLVLLPTKIAPSRERWYDKPKMAKVRKVRGETCFGI